MSKIMTAEQFYKLRDNRTNHIVSDHDYHKLSVRVVAGQETVRQFNGQVQLLLIANMLVRWCRHVELGFPDAPLIGTLGRNKYKTLYERMQAEVQSADPFGDFSFRPNPPPDMTYTLKVGGEHLKNEAVDFTINSDGWRVFAGKGHKSFDVSSSQINPIGPAFAACIGVAEAFKTAIKLPVKARVQETVISLLDFSVGKQALHSFNPHMPERILIGNTQIVGIGSVGSAVIYLIDMLPIDGVLHLIDCDAVEYVNLNRSPLFGVSDVGRSKVEAATEFLNGKLPTTAFLGRYDEFIDEKGRQKGDVDLLLSLANEFGVRAFIEHNFPPIQVLGTTSPSWQVNYHRHVPGRDDCSLCRFPNSEDHIQYVCSGTEIETSSGEQIDAALPFLSVAAAILTAADLIKLQIPGYPFTPNFGLIDFQGNLGSILTFDKKPKVSCFCAHRSQRIHKPYIGSSRFANFAFSQD